MTKKGLSEIVLVVDKSSSMSHLTQETIRNIANFIQEQKDVKGEAKFTLLYFDDEYDLRIFRQDLKDVSTKQDYRTRGSTALRDALGTIIDRIGGELRRIPENDRPDHVIVCTITDGLENASQKYSNTQLKSMIDVQRNVFNWTFIFMGAEEASLVQAQSWGIPQDLTLNYVADSRGLESSYGILSTTTKSLRSS